MQPAEDQETPAGFASKHAAFRRLEMYGTPCISRDFLREVGLEDLIRERLALAGWEALLDLSSASDKEDTCEFLASLEVDDQKIRYRHRGVWYIASSRRMKRALRCAKVREGDTDTHTNQEAWREMATGPVFAAGRSRGRELRDPWMFYMWRLVAYAVIGRFNGAPKISLLDLDILKGLYYGKRVLFISDMVVHWSRVSTRGPLTCGGIITHLLRVLHREPEVPEHSVVPAFPLDRAYMLQIRAVTVKEDGSLEWCYRVQPAREPRQRSVRQAQPEEAAEEEEMEEATEPVAPPVRRARTRAQTGAQRRARAPQGEPVTIDIEDSPPRARGKRPRTAPEEAPEEATAEQRMMFNVMRVLEYLAPEGADLNMSPPPGWKFGDAIPHLLSLHRPPPGSPSQPPPAPAPTAAPSPVPAPEPEPAAPAPDPTPEPAPAPAPSPAQPSIPGSPEAEPILSTSSDSLWDPVSEDEPPPVALSVVPPSSSTSATASSEEEAHSSAAASSSEDF